MATALETAIFDNLLGIFGGNEILLAIFAISLGIGLMAFLRIPPIMMLPLLSVLIFTIGYLVPTATIILGLIGGVLIAYFIYRMWIGM